ncbi:MAG: hypothetical protein O3C36_03245 [archaeon]|nr:hypothetical protein [archaeon]
MRSSISSLTLVLLLLLTSGLPLLDAAQGRSVHSTSVVDIFPQGALDDAGEWSVGAETSFTQATASYTETMVADQRLTMVHQRPVHLDTMTVWSSSSPTNSNYSVGAPDGAATWSTGPEIQLTGFDTSGLSAYILKEVHLQAAFQIPDALQEDTVRISVEHGDGFDLLKTFAHTQGNLDYINNSAFTLNITDLMEWTWTDISEMMFTLDYVSAGGVDDSRLVVDAVGLDITVQTPWYGGEVGYASSTFTGHDLPVIGLDFEAGTTDNMALDECGLKPLVDGTSGTWTSALFSPPPQQLLGRLHLSTSEGDLGNVSVEVALSQDGESVGEYQALSPNTLLPQATAYRVRVVVLDACVDEVWADVNDPSLELRGRVFGTNDGIDANYSRWLVFVNGDVVSNEAMDLGTFVHEWPIGAYLRPGADALEVSIRAWFTWDSTGQESTTALEINSISVSGGFDVEWDEDPVCEPIGDLALTEDNGGIILPLLLRCSDDRSSNEALLVQFTNTNTELIEVDLAEGDVRVRLLPEASGQAVIGVTVLDEAGNTWQDAFTVEVLSVDDPPVVAEFQSLIPVERDVETAVEMSWFDVDSTQLTASTNRSWATVDLTSNALTVTPPNIGFHTVLVSVCDQTGCTDREVDFEVMALPDLFFESMDLGDEDLTQGDVVSLRLLIRNDGQADASMVSVRCQANDQLIGVQTIPLIQPGELRAVTCEWQIPNDVEVVRFSAIIDRGFEIPEGNEDNNGIESLVAIKQAQEDGASSQDKGGMSGILGLGLVILSVGLIALLAYFMPAKVKKIE